MIFLKCVGFPEKKSWEGAGNQEEKVSNDGFVTTIHQYEGLDGNGGEKLL